MVTMFLSPVFSPYLDGRFCTETGVSALYTC